MATVLIVDDEPGIRTIISLSLDGDEFELRTAANGLEALAALAESPPDLMILDIMMPGMSGFEVLAAIRAQGLAPSTRIVITTCRTSEGDHVRGLDLGADEYLTKPFDPEELVAKLRALLVSTPEARRARRAAELAKAAQLDRLEAAAARTGRQPAPSA